MATLVRIGAFAGGAVLGVLGWWVLWYPLTWLGLFPHPWHYEGSQRVVDDPLGALWKVASVFVFAILAGVHASRSAGDRLT